MAGISSAGSLIHDSILRIRDILASGITDPVTRAGNERFVMTSFPERSVRYPLIVVKHENMTTRPMGMNTNTAERTLQHRISVFANNTLHRDTIADQVVHQLESIQFSGGTVGLIAGSLHDFRVLGTTQFDEPGEKGIHRKDVLIQTRFYS